LTNSLSSWLIVAGPVLGDGGDCMLTNSTVLSSEFYFVEAWPE
jgi:hypothetical protein